MGLLLKFLFFVPMHTMPTMRTGEVQKAMLSPRKTRIAEPRVHPASQAGW